MKPFNIIAFFFALFVAFTPDQALADIGGLTKCSESPAFTKRLNTSVKKLELRMAQYEQIHPLL